MIEMRPNVCIPDPRPDWLFGRNPGAIEASEKEGQRQLCASAQLPTEGSPGYPLGRNDFAEFWASTGVEFGDVTPGDSIFRAVTLPEGWLLKPTDHDMWSDLVDADGTMRARVFYKAAFYDRSAYMRPAR